MSLQPKGLLPDRDGQAGFVRPALLLIVALAAIGALSVWALGFDRAQPAGADGVTMSIQVFADKDKSSLVCDVGAVDRKCDIDAGTAFSIDVLTTSPPPNGYTAYRVALQYESTLTLQQQPGFEEHLLGACMQGSEKKDLGEYELSCKLQSRSTFSGPIVNVQFVCGAGGTSAQIDLIGGTKAGGSAYVDPNIAGSLVFLKSETKGSKAVADAVQVNCVDPTPTPTPTSTPTPTRTRTATPTQTPTPTPTTPAEPGKAKMTIQVYADAGKTEPVCVSGELFRKCDVFAGVPFSIDVVAAQPPDAGYTAYQIVVQYAGDVVLKQQPGLEENRAPNCSQGSESISVPKGKPGEEYHLSCKLSSSPTQYAGVLANVHLTCGQDGGSAQIDLVAGAGSKVSAYVKPSIYGSLIFLKSVVKGNKEVADSVYVNCLSDFDADGCTNIRELGSNALLGGQRDPAHFWDFFDVWTPDPNSPGDYVRNQAVDVDDIGAVASRFLVSGTATSLEDALTLPTSPTGYHASYDRGARIGPNSWNRGPADGAITVDDISAVAAQFLHSC